MSVPSDKRVNSSGGRWNESKRDFQPGDQIAAHIIGQAVLSSVEHLTSIWEKSELREGEDQRALTWASGENQRPLAASVVGADTQAGQLLGGGEFKGKGAGTVGLDILPPRWFLTELSLPAAGILLFDL